MAWGIDVWVVIATAAGLLLVGATAALLRRRAQRRQAERWAKWRHEHARRLPWELFRRRSALLRLSDGRRSREPGA